MTAIGIEVRGVARSRRLSLAEALRANGIRVMPTAWAQEHKRAFLKEIRDKGYGPAATRLLLTLRAVLWTLSLAHIPIRMGRELPFQVDRIYVMYCSAVIAVGAVGLGIVFGAGQAYGWFLFVPAVAMIATLFFEMCRSDRTFAYTSSYWVSHRRTYFGDLPSNVRSRAEAAATIPGVRVYRETLDADPLSYAARGWGPFKQVCYLGGYDTNNPRIDTF